MNKKINIDLLEDAVKENESLAKLFAGAENLADVEDLFGCTKDTSPLDFLQNVYTSPLVDLRLRVEAASKSLQYVHAKKAQELNLNQNFSIDSKTLRDELDAVLLGQEPLTKKEKKLDRRHEVRRMTRDAKKGKPRPTRQKYVK